MYEYIVQYVQVLCTMIKQYKECYSKIYCTVYTIFSLKMYINAKAPVYTVEYCMKGNMQLYFRSSFNESHLAERPHIVVNKKTLFSVASVLCGQCSL